MQYCECVTSWIEKTKNKFTTDTNITYDIYKCKNCKRLYVLRLGRYIEIAFDKNQKCYQVENGRTIKAKTYSEVYVDDMPYDPDDD